MQELAKSRQVVSTQILYRYDTFFKIDSFHESGLPSFATLKNEMDSIKTNCQINKNKQLNQRHNKP
jgi:hypothetical protein